MGRIGETIRGGAARMASMASRPSGWASFALANVLVSLLWVVPLGIGWHTGDATFYLASAGIASFMAMPFSFAWLLVYAIAERIDRTIDYMRKKKSKEDEKT